MPITLPTSFTANGEKWKVEWVAKSSVRVNGFMANGGVYPDRHLIRVCIGTKAKPYAVEAILHTHAHELGHVVTHYTEEERIDREAALYLEIRLSAGTVDLDAWDAAFANARKKRAKGKESARR